MVTSLSITGPDDLDCRGWPVSELIGWLKLLVWRCVVMVQNFVVVRGVVREVRFAIVWLTMVMVFVMGFSACWYELVGGLVEGEVKC